MTPAPKSNALKARGLVDHFFRHQYSRLVASLCRRFGTSRLQLVEDAVQEALAQALGTWVKRGLPDNPEAWLTRVAHNRVIDRLRRQAKEAGEFEVDDLETEPLVSPSFVDEIEDDELRMLFVCADPSLRPRARLVLCLKLLCGFNTQEIAARLFMTEVNVQKTLERGRSQLHNTWSIAKDKDWLQPQPTQLCQRLACVQHVIYLQFNEGYASLRQEDRIRPELCREAIRLAELLVSNPVGNAPSSWALLALLHFHAARMNAREDECGALLLLEDQDRKKWDQTQIRAGLVCFQKSVQTEEFCRYHGEAGILMEHCLAPSYELTRWGEIVELYELLEKLEPSPLYTLNRAIALCEWKGPTAALALLNEQAPPSWLTGYYLWDATMGELLRKSGKPDKAREYLKRAIEACPTQSERLLFEKRLNVTSS